MQHCYSGVTHKKVEDTELENVACSNPSKLHDTSEQPADVAHHNIRL